MCEYVFGGMDEARGGGGWGSFFVNCGTFYDYVLIALPAPSICFFVFLLFFLEVGTCVLYSIHILHFGSSGPHGQSLLYMSHIWARVERAMDSRSIVIGFDLHYKFQANFSFTHCLCLPGRREKWRSDTS